jgi:phage-related minor tail protein
VPNLSLVFDLIGRDVSASKSFKDVGDQAERTGKMGEKAGSGIASGLKMAGAALLGAGLVEGFKSLYEAADESRKIAALTTQVIKSTGGAAGCRPSRSATSLAPSPRRPASTTRRSSPAQNLLLTFTNVKNEVGKGNDIFNQATSIMTDMSVALGTDASGSAIQLGKALNDPIKGVTALQKVGVSFTESQKEQIKTLVATGDTLGAQKIILAGAQQGVRWRR